jgi:RNA-binding protein
MTDQPSASEVSQLRREGRQLGVSVNVGKAGLTDALARQVSSLLEHHPLVKVRLPATDKAERAQMAEDLAARTHSTLIDLVGRVVVLYKPLERDS